MTLISQCADLLYWHRKADCQPAFQVCDIVASGDIVPNAHGLTDAYNSVFPPHIFQSRNLTLGYLGSPPA